METSLSATQSGVQHPWNNYEFVRMYFNSLVTKFHFQDSTDNKEQFIFIIMMMPYELTLEFNQFYMLAIQFSNDTGVPVVGEEGEFGGDVYFFLFPS